jgi:hypothetical protein
MDSTSDADVWTLWQQQSGEEFGMPLNELRTKAERLNTKTRRWRLVTSLLLVVLLIVEAWQVWIGEEILERAGDLLTIVAFLYIAYRFRKHRLAAPPVALGRASCVEFYRAELGRQRDLSKDSWGYLLPFVPGVALGLFGSGVADLSTTQIIGLIAFGVALFLGIAWWNAHIARKLQNEIDAFDVS